ARSHAAAGAGSVSAAIDRQARGNARQTHDESARVAVQDERRLPADDEVAAPCGREGGHGTAASYRPARYAQPSRASSRPADRLSAAQQSNGPGDLRAVRRRSAVRVEELTSCYAVCVSATNGSSSACCRKPTASSPSSGGSCSSCAACCRPSSASPWVCLWARCNIFRLALHA